MAGLKIPSTCLGESRTDRCCRPSSPLQAAPSPLPYPPTSFLLDLGPPRLVILVSDGSATTSFRVQVHCCSEYQPSFCSSFPIAGPSNQVVVLPARRPSSSAMNAAGSHLLLLSYALSDAIEAVCHHACDHCEVDRRSETPGGQVAAVLYWLVAPNWGHILRHNGGRSGTYCLRMGLECRCRQICRNCC